jgi:hypothetical protein
LASLVAEPDLICTFGAPKLGNKTLQGMLDTSRIWRHVNDVDLVPRLPIPDPRGKEKMFTHACAPRVLDREAGWLTEYDRSEEDLLPFSTSSLHREFTRPPYWLIGHRMNEYCRKLKAMCPLKPDDESEETASKPV